MPQRKYPTRKKTAEPAVRYKSAAHLEMVKRRLRQGGATAYDIAEALEVSVRTAIRYVRALQYAGEPIEEVADGPRKKYRFAIGEADRLVPITDAQTIALSLFRSQGHLRGTGLDEYRDQFHESLLRLVRTQRAAVARRLERKIHDVNEAPFMYGDRADEVNDLLSALINEERVAAVHGKEKKRTLLDPLTLLTYKKGLYLIAYSHHHRGIRTFGLDDLHEIDWRRGDKFEYPRGYHPRKVVGEGFGLMRGPPTSVRILFNTKVERFIRRRLWHHSQKIKRVNGRIELTMELEGTTELVPWVLSWGDQAELVEPQSLRDEIASQLERMAARYRAPPG